MEALYLDVHGTDHRRNEWDFHHVVPRCRLKGASEKEWANQVGLKVPVFKTFHNLGKTALHYNVPLAQRPNKEIMRIVRFNLYENPSENPYDRFIGVTETVHAIAETSSDPHTSWLAGRLAENLRLQAPYILEGQVKIEVIN